MMAPAGTARQCRKATAALRCSSSTGLVTGLKTVFPRVKDVAMGIPAVTAYLKGVPGATSFAASLNSTFISIPFFIIDPRPIGTDKPLFGCADPACDL